MLTRTAVVLAGFVLGACSSIHSIEGPKAGGQVDGLAYFMPKKDFTVTITVGPPDKEGKLASKVTNVVFGTTAAYPDLSKQYLMLFAGNLFGKNTLDVTITESGLLSTAKSTTISNVTEAFKNLASSLGAIRPFSAAGETRTHACTDGNHTFVFAETPPASPCGMTITLSELGAETGKQGEHVVKHERDPVTEHSGIFYRQNLPYLLTANGKEGNFAGLVFSPSKSKTHFLPISRTFFSNNQADFTFIDGVPQKYKQDTDSELVALFKIPAEVLTAYFQAVGATFDAFKSNDEKEAAALSESLKLELAKKKYEACIAAIRANDTERIKQLSCQP